MKIRLLIFILISFFLTACVGVGSKGLFGTGVSVALDPRTVGTQIDDSIMQKSISAKILAKDSQQPPEAKPRASSSRPEAVIVHASGSAQYTKQRRRQAANSRASQMHRQAMKEGSGSWCKLLETVLLGYFKRPWLKQLLAQLITCLAEQAN